MKINSLIIAFLCAGSLLQTSCTSTNHQVSADGSLRYPAADENSPAAQINAKAVEYNPPANMNVQVVSTKACGNFHHTENFRTARNNEDTFYVLEVDCKRSGGSNQTKTLLRMDRKIMRGGQLSTMKKWQFDVWKKTKSPIAVPYLCFRGTVKQPLCQGGAGETTYSTVEDVVNMTADVSKFNKWTVE